MLEYCSICNEKKEDYSWKFRDGVWACGLHFKSSPPYNPTESRLNVERQRYKSDLYQPFREGEPSREFIDTYGEKTAKKWGMKDEQIKKAKDVYKDL